MNELIKCVSGRQALRSSVSGQLLVHVPRATTATIGSVAHFSLLAPPPGMGPLEVRLLPRNSESCLRLIYFDVAGAPLSRFLEGVPYKFLNE